MNQVEKAPESGSEVEQFIAVTNGWPGYWGRGGTQQEAFRKCQESAGHRLKVAEVVTFQLPEGAEPDTARTDGFGIYWDWAEGRNQTNSSSKVTEVKTISR